MDTLMGKMRLENIGWQTRGPWKEVTRCLETSREKNRTYRNLVKQKPTKKPKGLVANITNCQRYELGLAHFGESQMIARSWLPFTVQI